MSVLVLGLSHKSAPIGVLERLAVPADLLPKALTSLKQRAHVREAVVLSTCNRVEVYAHVSRYHGGMGDLRAFLAEWSGLAPEDFAERCYDYYDDRAAAHLFAVTAGLESMVVGERQVHQQVKEAFTRAEAEGAAGRVLHTLFTRALRVGKRARAETAISAGASSMVDVALDTAERVLGDLRGRTVLLLGAGKIGGMAGSRLQGRVGRIVVANRGSDKRDRLADRVGGDSLPLGRLAEGLAGADLVVCTTGASVPLLDHDTLAEALGGRRSPMVLLDLGVPRDVDPACAELPGVTILDVDTVREATQSGPTGAEVARARAIVEDEAQRFVAWKRSMRVEPTIAALRARAEDIRAAEVERLASRFAGLDRREAAALDALTRRIVNTLLHTPSVRLKDIADERGDDLHAEALRELFDLPPE